MQLAEQEREHAEDNANNAELYSLGPNADDFARRFVGHLARLSDNRGLFDYLMPKRMGRHLAGAFVDRYGDTALSEAHQVRAWVDRAVEVIAEGSA